MGKLEAIAVKPGSGQPMNEMTQAGVTREAGLAGDYRRGRPHNRQVAVLSADVWAQVCRELGAELPWTLRRANFLVSGVALPQAPGARLTIGALELEVRVETAPCEYMDAQHPGLRAALTPNWRGGVCCRVLNDAEVQVGDRVALS